MYILDELCYGALATVGPLHQRANRHQLTLHQVQEVVSVRCVAAISPTIVGHSKTIIIKQYNYTLFRMTCLLYSLNDNFLNIYLCPSSWVMVYARERPESSLMLQVL